MIKFKPIYKRALNELGMKGNILNLMRWITRKIPTRASRIAPWAIPLCLPGGIGDLGIQVHETFPQSAKACMFC